MFLRANFCCGTGEAKNKVVACPQHLGTYRRVGSTTTLQRCAVGTPWETQATKAHRVSVSGGGARGWSFAWRSRGKTWKSLEVCDEALLLLCGRITSETHYDINNTVHVYSYRQLRGVTKGQPVCQAPFDKEKTLEAGYWPLVSLRSSAGYCT